MSSNIEFTEQDQLYIRARGRIQGPYSVERLRRLKKRGQFGRLHEVSVDKNSWFPSSSVEHLLLGQQQSNSVTESKVTRVDSNGPAEGQQTHQGDQFSASGQTGKWHYSIRGETYGPVEESRIQELYRKKQIREDTQVWTEGMATWQPLSQIPEFANISQQSGYGGNSTSSIKLGEFLGSRRNLLIGGGVLAGVLCLALIIPLVIGGASGGDGLFSGAGGGVITNVDGKSGDAVIQKSVGIVLPYLIHTLKTGERLEDGRFGRGTGFVVSPDGYVITNRHVVEDFVPWSNASDDGGRIKRFEDEQFKRWEPLILDLSKKKISELQQTQTVSKTVAEKIIKGYRDSIKSLAKEYADNLQSIEPRVAVQFGEERIDAEIIHVSTKYDMAVLKLSQPRKAYFSLAKTDEITRSADLMAAGYPGTADMNLSEEENLNDYAKSLKAKLDDKSASGLQLQNYGSESVWDNLKKRSNVFTGTMGNASRLVTDDVGVSWVQHTAQIQHGNSGGPLIMASGSSEGRVIGINTIGARRQVTSANYDGIAYFAVAIGQLRNELDEHIPNIVWK